MSKIESKKSKRQSRILDALQLNPAKRVIELSSELNVSSETVRRDLAELDASGQIKRTYGGAIRATQFEPGLAERLKLNVEARERIARRTVALLKDAGSLFLGGGATTFHVARALSELDRPITVLTASFGIATELAQNPMIKVIFLPGEVEHSEGMVCGPETLEYIYRYHTPIAIIGASSIDQVGVSEALISAAQVYESMIANADRTFVVADASKLGNRALRVILRWGPSTTLITDSALDKILVSTIRETGGAIEVSDNTAK